MILDDVTSALDLLTEKKVRENIDEYLPNVTKIIISQRVASIKDCDLILLMDKGQIVNRGNHEELLEKSAIYREIYQSQVLKEDNLNEK